MSGGPLVASDRVVAALFGRGLASAAMDFARAAIARGDPRRAILAEQLDALRDGRGLGRAEEPPVALDLSLAHALVERHRYAEARCLLRAVEAAGERAPALRELLDRVLAPLPAEAEPSYEALLQLVGVGQASGALRALEEVLTELPDAPSWLRDRHAALAGLVRGAWREALAPVGSMTRETVLERLRERDLPGALEAARVSGAGELAERLSRLVEASAEEAEIVSDPRAAGTLPIEGRGMALFQLRMGALDAADGSLRRLLAADETDEGTRAILADVLEVRRALGDEVEPMPSRAASVHWLNKTRRADGGGWQPGVARYGRYGDDDADEPTDVLGAADEAELLLKLGKTEPALALYRVLAIRHPDRETYRARVAEIEALIAQNVAPAISEVTARHDLSALIEESLPTDVRRRLDARPTMPSLAAALDLPDDGPTLDGPDPEDVR